MIRRSIAAALLSITLAGASPPPERPLVLAFGDSLTAGYGLDQGLGFAPQLQATLRRHGIAASVVDGGVSGDTTEAGKARLGWTLDGLERKPDLVIVELGANDMLRGLDPKLTEANLDAILAELKRRKIPVAPDWDARGAQSGSRLHCPVRGYLFIARAEAWLGTLPVFPGRGRRAARADPGRRTASDV